MNEPNVPAQDPKPVGAGENPNVGEKPAVAANQLTPEQQMEAFAEELKEQDWGHQPC